MNFKNSFKCIVIALTFENHIILSNTEQELKLPCLDLIGEVNQKALANAYFQITSYKTNRQFMLLGSIDVKKESFQVYAVIDAF